MTPEMLNELLSDLNAANRGRLAAYYEGRGLHESAAAVRQTEFPLLVVDGRALLELDAEYRSPRDPRWEQEGGESRLNLKSEARKPLGCGEQPTYEVLGPWPRLERPWAGDPASGAEVRGEGRGIIAAFLQPPGRGEPGWLWEESWRRGVVNAVLRLPHYRVMRGMSPTIYIHFEIREEGRATRLVVWMSPPSEPNPGERP